MKIEYLDIYDKNNQNTGLSKDRNLIHRDGDWHRTSHLYIINEKNKILCNKRHRLKKTYPDYWDLLFGGHVSAGETYESTIIREVKEELDLNIKLVELVHLGNFVGNQKESSTNIINREFRRAYLLIKNLEIPQINFQKSEISKIKYFSINELKSILNGAQTNFSFVPDFQYYLRIINKIEKVLIQPSKKDF